MSIDEKAAARVLRMRRESDRVKRVERYSAAFCGAWALVVAICLVFWATDLMPAAAVAVIASLQSLLVLVVLGVNARRWALFYASRDLEMKANLP